MKAISRHLRNEKSPGAWFSVISKEWRYPGLNACGSPGDRLLLYTDGITEAENEQNRLYDRDGYLKNFFAARTPGDAQTFISALINDVKAFMGSAPQADDITALYLMRNA